MKWFEKKIPDKIPELPDIDEISEEIPAISEYLDAFRLPEVFSRAESDVLPVIDTKANITGIVSEYDLAKVLPEWSFEDESYRFKVKVSDIMTKEVWTEPEHTNIKELLSSVHKMHTRVIPVVDKNGKYTGKCITRTALISFLTGMVKPRTLGGLATPLGVYLTDGRHRTGAGNAGLILTGVAFAGIIIPIQLITGLIFNYMPVPEAFILFIQLVLFILVLKITPLSKYHAAEHETIHAMEKGLPLTVETVRMQPRPHRRCGTNIMVLLIGIQFVILLSYELTILKTPFAQFLFLIIGLLLVFSGWKKSGMWIQEYFTTSPASDSQIMNGIKAGEELLKKHKEDLNPKPVNFFEKIWNMGIIQILGSFLFTLWVFNYILYLL